MAGTRLLARNRAVMYTRLSGGALWFCAPATILNPSGNAPVVMGRLVMKFGGTSVANIERIRNVARHVKREVDAGHEVAVVVSAMAGKTNELVEWCREASPMHDAREYDAVVASGEQVTAGLLALSRDVFGAGLSPSTTAATVGLIVVIGLVASVGAVRRVLAIDPVRATSKGGR
mgnify:CR=1 FL=1